MIPYYSFNPLFSLQEAFLCSLSFLDCTSLPIYYYHWSCKSSSCSLLSLSLWSIGNLRYVTDQVKVLMVQSLKLPRRGQGQQQHSRYINCAHHMQLHSLSSFELKFWRNLVHSSHHFVSFHFISSSSSSSLIEHYLISSCTI